MTASHTRGNAWLWTTLTVIAVSILWTHASILSAGFRADDYYAIVRPWTAAEIRSALTGSWDPFGVNDLYHRPLTALYQAALYPLFHSDARALHAVSLAMVGIVALGLFRAVSRETASPVAGLITAVTYIVHPALPDATSAWISNQISLLGDLSFVAAVLTWQRVRRRPVAGWWPLGLIAVLAVYIKEDGVMILPTLLAWQSLRAHLIGDVAVPSRSLVTASATLIGLLVVIRIAVYPYAAPWPLSSDAWWYYTHSLLSGPFHVLIKPPGSGIARWIGMGGVVLCLVFAAAGAMTGRLRAETRYMLAAGMVAMAALGLPLLINGHIQHGHFLVLTAALMIGATFAGLVEAGIVGRAASIVIVVGIMLNLSFTARGNNARYAPCSEESLDHDDLVKTWEVVAPELRAWVSRKRAACEAGTYEPLPADFSVSQMGR